MIHFAYPNASNSDFLGCGRYVALPPEKFPEPADKYKIAAPNNINIGEIRRYALTLAPDTEKIRRMIIYEKKDDKSEVYIGDSLELAYLLALISRSRKLKLKISDDIWSTGAIIIKERLHPFLKEGFRPYLKKVDSKQFDFKINEFLYKANETLFIVPAENIHREYEILCEQENVEILSLNEFQPYIQKKTILKVEWEELELLVKIIFRQPAFSFSNLKIFFLSTLSVTYLMFFLLWLHAFNFIYIDEIIERYTIAFGDFLIAKEKKFSDDIVLIVIEDKSFDISWREKHALLIDKLSKAGAKIIAFDMYFEDQSKIEFDDPFINAIKKAGNVIVGVSELQKNEPKMFKELKKAVSGYGILCINETLLYSTKAPLLVIKEDGKLFDSMPLAVARAFYSDSKDFIVRVEEQSVFLKHPNKNEEIKINFSDVEFSRNSCPAIHEGDQVANMFIDLSPPDFLKSPKRRFLYDEIISSKSDMRQQFEGKIVLVGVQIRNKDCLSVHRGLKNEKCCFGMEVHADVLNTILSWVHIQEYPPKQQLIFIAISAILGAVLV